MYVHIKKFYIHNVNILYTLYIYNLGILHVYFFICTYLVLGIIYKKLVPVPLHMFLVKRLRSECDCLWRRELGNRNEKEAGFTTF